MQLPGQQQQVRQGRDQRKTQDIIFFGQYIRQILFQQLYRAIDKPLGVPSGMGNSHVEEQWLYRMLCLVS